MRTNTKTVARKQKRKSGAASESTKKNDRGLAHASSGNGDLGQLKEPKSPMPAQHQRKPGIESKLRPRPKYKAPLYRGSGKLEGKVALITGGDSGIGRAVAVLYAREGAEIAIVYLPVEQSDAEEVQAAVLMEGGQILLIPGDVTDRRFCDEAVRT